MRYCERKGKKMWMRAGKNALHRAPRSEVLGPMKLSHCSTCEQRKQQLASVIRGSGWCCVSVKRRRSAARDYTRSGVKLRNKVSIPILV